MAYASRRDSTHAVIRDALRQAGAYVEDAAQTPSRGYDLLVLFRGATFYVEVKTDHTRNDLTANEIVTRQEIRRHGGKHIVACSVEEILKAIGATR